MARRLFFVDRIDAGRALLEGDDAQHLSRVLRVEPGQRFEISDNLALYLAEPQSLPSEWRRLAAAPNDPQTARVAADYLAGMTDRFCTQRYLEICGEPD